MRLVELNRPVTEFSAINTIIDNCSEILKIYRETNKILWRGISLKNMLFDPFFISNSPENRPPLNTGRLTDTAINRKLFAADFEARRDNSIFCYSNPKQVTKYGKPYMIFPFDGFNFTYSKYYDLTTDLVPIGWNDHELEDDFDDDEDEYCTELIDNTDVNAFITDHGFKNDNINTALLSNVEIYVQGKYVAISDRYYQFVREKLGL